MTIPFNKAEHRALMAKINNSISESTDIVLMFRSIPYGDHIMQKQYSYNSSKWQQMSGIQEKEYIINLTTNSGDLDNHQQKVITNRKKRVHWSSDIEKIYHIKRIAY